MKRTLNYIMLVTLSIISLFFLEKILRIPMTHIFNFSLAIIIFIQGSLQLKKHKKSGLLQVLISLVLLLALIR